MKLRNVLARVGRLFPLNSTIETVWTSMRFDASPEAVWRGMLFYEEVPTRATPLLRVFLPAPISTTGDKTRVDAIIQCNYEGGRLEKRITAAEPARLVRFDVLIQELGIEDCISMTGGSYEIQPVEGGSLVILSTLYRGSLWPRWLCRPFEHYLAHKMHRYILDGMQAAVAESALTSEYLPKPSLVAHAADAR